MFSLKRQLKKSLNGATRVAILGIGSPLRGDDALGLAIIEELKKSLRKQKKRMPLKLFVCGVTPENYTGEIKKFKPSHILIIDAAGMGRRPGMVSILDPERESFNVSFSTHCLPVKMLINYLVYSLNCQVIPIIIQPKSIEFALNLSRETESAIRGVSASIVEALKE